MDQPGVEEAIVDFGSRTAYVAPSDGFDVDEANAALARRGNFRVTRR